MRRAWLGVALCVLAGCGAESADKQEFAALVRANAQDPSGLEIVEWGELKEGRRYVRFRCALVGTAPRQIVIAQPGHPQPTGGNRIMLDEAQLEYKDGKLVRAFVRGVAKTWNVPRQ